MRRTSMDTTKILLLDFDAGHELGSELREILQSSHKLEIQAKDVTAGGVTGIVSDPAAILSGSPDFNPDLIFTTLSKDLLKDARALIQSIKRVADSPILVVVEAGQPDEILDLLDAGAADFITAPLRYAEILPRVYKLVERMNWRNEVFDSLKEHMGLKQIVGESPRFVAEVEKLRLVAKCDVGVLISGETGTGKELVARAIHYLSPRANSPFISVNCGAIPMDLVENELFGHERGAYTGATTSQNGLIREADSGTLFLDEIDSLPSLAQVKLLRFLQEKEYRPLGSGKILKADVRVIAASNVDLERAVESGKLRQDLYYRLNVVPITLPSLRERREDIPLLARHFLAKYSREFGKQVRDISEKAMCKLLEQNWPGNVRELEHVIQRAVVMCEGEIIRESHVCLNASERAIAKSFQQRKAEVIAEFEKGYIKSLLQLYEGNITKAAEAAQKNRRAFWQLINKHGIKAETFRISA
jgi:two-component system response regulator GlrR